MNEIGKINLELAALDITICKSRNQYYVTSLLLHNRPYSLFWCLCSQTHRLWCSELIPDS
jgi:hypothetical protein